MLLANSLGTRVHTGKRGLVKAFLPQHGRTVASLAKLATSVGV